MVHKRSELFVKSIKIGIYSGSKKSSGQKNFRVKKIWGKKIWGKKNLDQNFLVINILGKKFLGKKILFKKIWIRIFFMSKKTGRVNPRLRIYAPPPPRK